MHVWVRINKKLSECIRKNILIDANFTNPLFDANFTNPFTNSVSQDDILYNGIEDK